MSERIAALERCFCHRFAVQQTESELYRYFI